MVRRIEKNFFLSTADSMYAQEYIFFFVSRNCQFFIFYSVRSRLFRDFFIVIDFVVLLKSSIDFQIKSLFPFVLQSFSSRKISGCKRAVLAWGTDKSSRERGISLSANKNPLPLTGRRGARKLRHVVRMGPVLQFYLVRGEREAGASQKAEDAIVSARQTPHPRRRLRF